MGKTIRNIEDLNKAESVKEVIHLSDNLICVKLKDSRDIQFEDLDNWELSNLRSYHHTEIHLKRKD